MGNNAKMIIHLTILTLSSKLHEIKEKAYKVQYDGTK